MWLDPGEKLSVILAELELIESATKVLTKISTTNVYALLGQNLLEPVDDRS